MISLADNQISGSIPFEISKFINLIFLSLEGNKFTGIIPSEIAKLGNLQRVLLSNNRLSGNIPASIGNLSMLDEIHLENNELSGTIPPSFGNCPMLVLLDLSQNYLSGTITNELFNVSPFSVKLNLSRNHLVGSLPEDIGTLTHLVVLDVSENKFSSVIPGNLGNCISLESLYMQGNLIQGCIPQSLKYLKGMQHVDFSRNNLSEKIPDFLETLITLKYLNLSWNNLEGEVPMRGVFANASAFAIVGNKRLCGGVPELKLPRCSSEGLCGGIPGLQLPKCSSNRSNEHKVSSEELCFLIGYILGLLAVGCLFWLKRKKKVSRPKPTKSFIRLSYQQLCQATNGFSPTNLVSEDCFGSVYKGELDPQFKEKAVAIKVFNEESANVFITESEVLQNIFHRNIVKIKGTCSSIVENHEFKAIVYKYMEHGNLERWMHPTSMTFCDTLNMPQTLNLSTKINIAIDVASALDYLHNQLDNPLAHRNLKPSNIWLDTDMRAHVSDFGQAKFITEIGNTRYGSLTALAGTFGYMPPEYYRGSIVSTKGDVYSYGIILLEMLTGKKATDFMFDERFKLQNFVSDALPDSIRDIIDPVNLHELDSGNEARTEDCLSMLFNIGVKCAMEVSQLRPYMDDTLSMLKKVGSIYQVNSSSRTAVLMAQRTTKSLLFYGTKMDPNSVTLSYMDLHKTLSYMDLHKATDGFSSTNLVGAGGFGSVYKGTSNDKYVRLLLRNSGIEDGNGTPVAIKVFNLQRRGAARSFNTEYQILRNIQHPNFVKIITTCTSVDQVGQDFRAILYEFMDRGSLETWLHPTNKKNCDGSIKPQILSLRARINIAIDVACALTYLHHRRIFSIIHCDLKPSNILLDKNMVAHIADFGLAISLPESPNMKQCSSSTGMRGTTGYIAPEYGLGCQMTTKGDTYSFGILLLEMLTGKKPNHPIFRRGLNLHNFVWMALPNDVFDITDPLMKVMSSVNEGEGKRVQECLTRMFNIGLACSKTPPKDRPNMRAVLRELQLIRDCL